MINPENTNIKTADIITNSLLDWGIDTIFGLPGDGINGFIESLRQNKDKIKFILVRHEESAAFMACAYAKYTGKLGACVSTSGPGAIHLLNGLYDAKADNTPVIAITGSTYSDLMNSNYQQDVNLLQLYSDLTVYNSLISVPEQAEMAVDIACRTALTQRGVSHITIPIDVQEKKISGNYSRHNIASHTSDTFVTSTSPSYVLLENAAKILNSGNKVVMLVGQGALEAGKEVLAVAKRLNAPVVKALLGKTVIPDDNSYSLGGLGLLGTEPASDAMNEADILILVGTSFPYIDYLPKPQQAKGIQIDIKAEKIGLRFPVEVGLVGDSKSVLSSLLPMLVQKDNSEFLISKQNAMKEWNKLLRERSRKITNNPIKPQQVVRSVSDELEDNAIISVDCGTVTTWGARYINARDGMKFSVSGTLSSMANGLPYAIAAQIAFPDRQSIALVGDGGFTMLMGEFATAVQYNLPIKVIVLKNNTLGMIRWEQLGFLGNPEYGVEFTPIDFAKLAECCGGKGYTITDSSEVEPSIHLGLKEKKPTIIQVEVDPFEPPVPPKVESEYITNLALSFAKGQPYKTRIGLTLFRNKVHESLKEIHSHDDDQFANS